jgi:hypothetical protein
MPTPRTISKSPRQIMTTSLLPLLLWASPWPEPTTRPSAEARRTQSIELEDQAREQTEQDHAKGAAALFLQAVRADPSNIDAWCGLGETSDRAGDLGGAVRVLRALARLGCKRCVECVLHTASWPSADKPELKAASERIVYGDARLGARALALGDAIKRKQVDAVLAMTAAQVRWSESCRDCEDSGPKRRVLDRRAFERWLRELFEEYQEHDAGAVPPVWRCRAGCCAAEWPSFSDTSHNLIRECFDAAGKLSAMDWRLG